MCPVCTSSNTPFLRSLQTRRTQGRDRTMVGADCTTYFRAACWSRVGRADKNGGNPRVSLSQQAWAECRELLPGKPRPSGGRQRGWSLRLGTRIQEHSKQDPGASPVPSQPSGLSISLPHLHPCFLAPRPGLASCLNCRLETLGQAWHPTPLLPPHLFPGGKGPSFY